MTRVRPLSPDRAWGARIELERDLARSLDLDLDRDRRGPCEKGKRESVARTAMTNRKLWRGTVAAPGLLAICVAVELSWNIIPYCHFNRLSLEHHFHFEG